MSTGPHKREYAKNLPRQVRRPDYQPQRKGFRDVKPRRAKK